MVRFVNVKANLGDPGNNGADRIAGKAAGLVEFQRAICQSAG